MVFKKHFLIIAVLLIVLVSGLFTYKTYGTYWDEYLQRDMGKMSYNYVFHHDNALKTFMDKDYGVLIELPLYAMEVKLFANDFNASIEARHLSCFLIFFTGLIFFYFLLLALNFNTIWATIGTVMLVLSPRIYGHAFFNSKDIPLMVFYIISFYTLLLMIKKQSYGFVIIHALSTALIINVRITGVILLPLTCFFLGVFMIKDSHKSSQGKAWSKMIKLLALYIISSAVFVYIFWPYLWENPIPNFIAAYSNMSKFRWDNYTYLMGQHIHSINAPWYYLPKWIAITTPIFYLLAFAISLIFFVINLYKNRHNYFLENNILNHLMALSFLLLPIIIIIYLNSTLYDSWRHVYFIYPFLLVSALYGLTALFNSVKTNKWLVVLLCISFMGFELSKMIKSHPYHYVYFNEIPGKKYNEIKQQNDFDFWGVSFKQAYEKILQLDKRKVIKISATVSPAYYNFLFLKHQMNNCRLQFVDGDSLADYYVTNYRYNPNDHAAINNKKYFSLMYANSEFITVFKLK
jgi:hypothetical protein